MALLARSPKSNPARIMNDIRKVAVLSAALLVWSARAASAETIDMPREGSATYVAYYLNHVSTEIDMGEQGTSALIEGFGITRNTSGQKLFDRMSVHCIFYEQAKGDQYSETGACTEIDPDGDKIDLTFQTGTQTLIGGTGKYKGITGTGTFSGHPLRPPAAGSHAVELNHTVTWRIIR
jgi:hypothetical protein